LLLHLVGALGLPEQAAASGALARRPLRWVLHRLALTLVPIAADDPAALAFAGLRPGDDPPDLGEPGPDELELAAVGGFADAVAAALCDLLGEPGTDPLELLERVCRRVAEVVADPGWIEVRLDLGDVSTGIRRAGLDLDPGWLPWLGVVVRFVYG
jgi:hypothetical protein